MGAKNRKKKKPLALCKIDCQFLQCATCPVLSLNGEVPTLRQRVAFFLPSRAAIPKNMRFISKVVGFGHRSVVFGSIFSTTRGAVIGCRNRSVVFGFIFSTTRMRRVGCGDRNVVFELISSKGGRGFSTLSTDHALAFFAFLRELQKRIERHFLHGCMKNNYLKHKGEMWDSHPARRPSPASLTLYPSPLTCTSHPPPFNPHLPHPTFHLPPLTLTKVIADHQANNGVCSSRGGRLRRSGPP